MKKILWGAIALIGLWIIISEKQASLLGITIVLVGLGLGLRELKKEKQKEKE